MASDITDESGQTMAEYGLVLAVITIGLVAMFGVLNGAIIDRLGAVRDLLNGIVG
jgi:Flp pilus assembly pilin Flp